jgi:hypothetical protein
MKVGCPGQAGIKDKKGKNGKKTFEIKHFLFNNGVTVMIK